jgi:hypothetical protein
MPSHTLTTENTEALHHSRKRKEKKKKKIEIRHSPSTSASFGTQTNPSVKRPLPRAHGADVHFYLSSFVFLAPPLNDLTGTFTPLKTAPALLVMPIPTASCYDQRPILLLACLVPSTDSCCGQVPVPMTRPSQQRRTDTYCCRCGGSN